MAMQLPLADEPRWVEAHGMATDPASWRRDLAHGFVVGNDRARLAVASADVDARGLAAIAREVATHAILVVTDELAATLREAGREVARAIVHTLPDPALLPELDGAVAIARDALATAALPEELRTELGAATGTVWTAYVDGAPVSFAYAPWRSARWFDISVDTLPGARQLGLGTIVASAMLHHERAAGREPVWAANDDNHASLALARRLGFVAVDELWVAVPYSPTAV